MKQAIKRLEMTPGDRFIYSIPMLSRPKDAIKIRPKIGAIKNAYLR